MKKLSVASHLSNEEYQMLMNVYAKHNSSMGLEMRKKYSLSDIANVERDNEDDCLNVHYSNGDWWKYYNDGTWG